jgi:hypothetical protein
MDLFLMNMLGLSLSLCFAHIPCYWKFFLLHYVQVLCQSSLWEPEYAYLSHVNVRYINSGQTQQRKPLPTIFLLLRVYPSLRSRDLVAVEDMFTHSLFRPFQPSCYNNTEQITPNKLDLSPELWAVFVFLCSPYVLNLIAPLPPRLEPGI